MGATESKREPNGPGTSRVPDMFKPDLVEVIDFKSRIGIVRIFWVRKELRDTKPPLVVCHGWGGGAGYWFKLNKFVARDRAVLYLDLPGFGESERSDIDDPEVTWPEILEETIFSQISGKFYMAGHSLGGWLSSLMALRPGMKQRLAGLILLDTAGYSRDVMVNSGMLENLVNKLFMKCSDLFGDAGLISALHMMPDCLEVWLLTKFSKDISDKQGPVAMKYAAQINTIKPPTGDTAFQKLWRDDGFIPVHPMVDVILEQPENYPKNVLFIWGTKSMLSPVPGELLEDFFLDSSYDTQIQTKYIIGGGHQFPGIQYEETAQMINKFIERKERVATLSTDKVTVENEAS